MTDHRLGTGYTLPPELGSVRGVHRQPRLAGGAIVTENGTLASDDFVAGASGWQISGNGDAEFNNATIRGPVVADSFSTGATGTEHIEIKSTSLNEIDFYTGDSAETAPGKVYVNNVPDDSASDRLLDLSLKSPAVSSAGATYSSIELLSARLDGSFPAQMNLLPHEGGSLGADFITVRDSTGGYSGNGVIIQSALQVAIVTGSGSGKDILLQADGQVHVNGSAGLKVDNTATVGAVSSSGAISGTTVDGTTLTASVDVKASHDIESLGAGQGIIVHSIDGTRWRIGVTNSGALSIAAA